jgi:MoaA/NifB/PqqE/SkfB family radical SAM enzyme
MSKEIVKIETMEPKNRLRIEFMVGNYCNYKCWYCGPYANGGDTRWHHDYNELLKNFKYLLDFYIQNGRNKFEINILGGEPSLWPDVAKFARDIKKDYNAKITMSSNASRSLRWWEENATAFDKILFSYHHKEADIDHYIKVLDLVYDKKVPLNALILMDPTVWDECVEAIETLKIKSKNPWFICAMEVHPPQYTSEQREIFKKHVKRRPPIWRILKDEYENFLKGKTTVIYNDGSKGKVERNIFSTNDLNYFQGWMCNIGIENINIQKDGKITGTCGNLVYNKDKFYNLYDPKFTENFKPNLEPTMCTKLRCWCQPEMLMTKWKTEENKKVIPLVPISLMEYQPNKYTSL